MPREGYYLPTRHLVSQDDAAIIERPQVPRSRFTGSWTRKTAFDAGYLVPFLLDEILPGDHMSYNVTAYVRMSTPLFPLFDNQRIDTFFFYVPNRLLWDSWTKFMGEQATPTSSIDFTIPQISTTGGAAVGSLLDHFGIPFVSGNVNVGSVWTVNALPFRAYNQIYNAWFRDQNVIASATIKTDDVNDSLALYTLRRRAKSHDYFTSALPWPQKFLAPTIPLGGMAPVLGIGYMGVSGPLGGAGVDPRESNGATGHYDFYTQTWIAGTTVVKMSQGDTAAAPEVFADLSAASSITINLLRQAWLVQSLLERDARGGTRYVELIRSHFGVTNPDFRLQRPEYIGGGQSPLTITPVAQTAPTESVPVGALGAAGTAVGSHRASYAATEHGYIIGLINVRSELSYQQGLHKMWSRLTRYDFYWPALAGLGEQAVLRQELWATGTFVPGNDVTVFGYQERWHEYRTRTSEVTGIMRSGVTGSLDAWHLAQLFLAAPTLSQAFIEDTPPMERVLAAAELAVNQQYLADILIQRNAVRALPTFGTPASLGRF